MATSAFRTVFWGAGLVCIACGGSSFTANNESAGSGGASASTGGVWTGGDSSSFGGNESTSTGGTGANLSPDTGGANATGPTGGAPASGGVTASGGVKASGGVSNTAGSQLFETVSFGERENSTFVYVTNDTDLLSSSPTYNYGWAPDFGCNGNPQRVGLVKFRTSDFGDTYGHGRTLVAARLHLWTTSCLGCQASAGTLVQIFEMKQNWQEVASGSTGSGGIPNWTQADIDSSSGSDTIVDWNAPGAQPPSRAASELAHFSPTLADKDYVISLPTSLVQTWMDDPDTNYGVALVISASIADSVTFITTDGNSAKSPWLEVDMAN